MGKSISPTQMLKVNVYDYYGPNDYELRHGFQQQADDIVPIHLRGKVSPSLKHLQ
jgi:hypothetical protein